MSGGASPAVRGPVPGGTAAAAPSDSLVASLAESSDALLAARAGDGDVGAFTVLARRYSPLLRGYATRVLGSWVDSDDVVQDAFVTAWDQLPGLHDPAAVKPWLVQITTRKALDRRRGRREHVDIDDHDRPAPADSGPEHRTEASARGDALHAALVALPEDQRQCWVLRELAGCSYTDIAVELGVPLSTVRGTLARARKTLLQRMEGWR